MVAYTGTQVSNVAITKATGRLRTVPLDGGFVRSARAGNLSRGLKAVQSMNATDFKSGSPH